jgi:pteridine reductase
MNNDKTKVAVVTGGARRIGRAVAMHLHQSGFDIALHYRHSAAEAEAIALELCALRSGSCRIFQADLNSTGKIAELCLAIKDIFPSIDLLVNNASGFEPTPIESCTESEFDEMISSNLRGPYFLIQGLLPLMCEGASIVNILDVHINRPLNGFNAYGAAKSGLASLTRSLAVELGPRIRVNGVAPGAILWPESDETYDEAMRELTVAATPLARLGDPEDIARTVAFLAIGAPFITGQVVTVDGGRSLTN